VTPLENALYWIDALDDFLDGFPDVSREQAVAFLEMAKDALLPANDESRA